MPSLLSLGGAHGAYVEPRTADGREVLSEYVVVWAPKMSPSELAHVKQTNPAAIGQARLGDRRGLRVHTDQAQVIHQVLRPDAAFLPGGPKSQYVVGPFPWGSDRQAIIKAMKQAGWFVKALQPMQPVPGRGTMWILQSVDAPPQMIFHMAHGEVVVSKHRPAEVTNKPAAHAASESIQQLEARIQSAVLAKMPTNMEQDDVPERLATLESQVQQLMVKNTSLEGKFADLSQQNSKQFAVVQQQIQQQSQSFHGQLENQTQSVQAMFESQMSQIRNLLAKRPRDEAPME